MDFQEMAYERHSSNPLVRGTEQGDSVLQPCRSALIVHCTPHARGIGWILE